MAQLDIEKLLNQTFFSIDTSSLLLGIIDFLEFSEHNLSWQRQRDIRRAEAEGDATELSPEDEHLTGQYRAHLIQNQEYRFDVSLSQRIRYAGLVAFVTTIEWCSKALSNRLVREIPPLPSGENEHVHFFASLNAQSASGFDQQIDHLRRLVYVRNCIVHASGFLEGYKYENQIRHTVTLLDGFRVWGESLLGESICIERKAVDRYAVEANEWIPELDKKCTTLGVLKN